MKAHNLAKNNLYAYMKISMHHGAIFLELSFFIVQHERPQGEA